MARKRYSDEDVLKLLRQIDAFADAIAGDAPYPVSPDVAVNSAACFEAMHKAAASGGWETV